MDTLINFDTDIDQGNEINIKIDIDIVNNIDIEIYKEIDKTLT